MSLFHVFMLFFGVSLACGGETVRVTEAGLGQLLKSKNELIKADDKNISSFENLSGHFRRSFIPNLEIEGAYETFNVGETSKLNQPSYLAELSLNVFNGGIDQAKEQINDLEIKSAKARSFSNKMELLEEARKSYWRGLYYRSLIDWYGVALGLVDENEKAARRRIDAGQATRSNLYEFQIKKQDLMQDQERARLANEKNLGHLKVLLGLEQSSDIELEGELAHSHNWQQIVQHDEGDHAYLVAEQKLLVEKSRKLAALENKSWLPKVDAYALYRQKNRREEYSRIDDIDRRETALGLRLKWNLSEGIQADSRKRSALHNSSADNHRLRYLEQEIDHEIHIEIEELKLLDRMVHVATKTIEQSKEFYRLTKSEYSRGVKESGDMLSATEKLIESEIKKMQIIRDFQFAKSHILKKFGK